MPRKYGYLRILLVLGLLVTMQTACEPKDQTTPPAPDLASSSKLIKFIYNHGSQIKTGDYLTVIVTNLSSVCIAFPYDFGTQITYQENGKTMELKNNVDHRSKENIVLDPVGSVSSGQDVVLNPDVASLHIQGRIDLQATILGHTCDDHRVVPGKIFFSVAP